MSRKLANTTLLSLATVVLAIQTGCSAKVRDYPPDNPAVGGGNATGGTSSVGGNSSIGGTTASSSASTGGAVSTGGSSSGIGTGGTSSAGGASSAGGTTVTSSTNIGGATTGGATQSASGGTSSGGTSATGGSAATVGSTGGTSSAAGTSSAGGAAAGGSLPTTGGSQMVTGGTAGSGGALTATGGVGGSASSCPFGATTALCGTCAVWTFDSGAQDWTAVNNGPGGACATTAVRSGYWPNTNNPALRVDVTADGSNCRVANVTFPVCLGGTDVTGRTLYAKVLPARTDGQAAATGRLWLWGPSLQSSSEISIPDNAAMQITVPITTGGIVINLGISYEPAYPWEGNLWLDDVYIQ